MRRHGVAAKGTRAILSVLALATTTVDRAGADASTHHIAATTSPPLLAPLTPGRLLDTRPGTTTVDGAESGGGSLTPGLVRRVAVAGRAGALASSDAVVFNVVAVGASASGFLRTWACDSAEPVTSTVNFSAGQAPISNSTIAAVGAGDICVIASARVHVIIDVVSQFVEGSGYQPQPVTRCRRWRGRLRRTAHRSGSAACTECGDSGPKRERLPHVLRVRHSASSFVNDEL